ncbi:MAG: hypothetical protein ACKVIF_10740, partial [Rhodospirillales bacterium]
HHLHEILPEIDWFVFLKSGQLIDEGHRNDLLTEEKISNLFEMPIQLNEVDGRLIAAPSSV